MIKYFLIIFLLLGCSADEGYPPKWVRSLETLPKEKGFIHAGIFTVEDNILSQQCDSHGNQVWFKYDPNTHSWSHSKYVTFGCLDND